MQNHPVSCGEGVGRLAKKDEARLCPDCPLVPYFYDEALRESWTNQRNDDDANTNLKICARMRALARQHGNLYLCRHFNYGLVDQPQQQPPPQPKPKTERQTPILMFTERHRTGDSWNYEGKLYCPDKKSKQN